MSLPQPQIQVGLQVKDDNLRRKMGSTWQKGYTNNEYTLKLMRKMFASGLLSYKYMLNLALDLTFEFYKTRRPHVYSFIIVL